MKEGQITICYKEAITGFYKEIANRLDVEWLWTDFAFKDGVNFDNFKEFGIDKMLDVIKHRRMSATGYAIEHLLPEIANMNGRPIGRPECYASCQIGGARMTGKLATEIFQALNEQISFGEIRAVIANTIAIVYWEFWIDEESDNYVQDVTDTR